jgi:hypothetical protein
MMNRGSRFGCPARQNKPTQDIDSLHPCHTSVYSFKERHYVVMSSIYVQVSILASLWYRFTLSTVWFRTDIVALKRYLLYDTDSVITVFIWDTWHVPMADTTHQTSTYATIKINKINKE